MRRLLVALGLVASISRAFAADYELPTLRGSDAFVPAATACCLRWGGFYAGVQIGYGVASIDFSTSTSDLVAHVLRELALEVGPSNWQVLGKANVHSASYGGFVGYNVGWESLILGFEFNYNRTSFSGEAPMSPIRRVVSAGGNTYDLTIAGSASMRITDFATLRARAGVEVGNLLPFAFIGVAAGRADLTRSATASGQENPATPCDGTADPPCTPFSFSESETKNGAFIYGWSLGGGMDVMVMPNIFLRAEYEFVAFSPVWDISAVIQTARVGLGVKF